MVFEISCGGIKKTPIVPGQVVFYLAYSENNKKRVVSSDTVTNPDGTVNDERLLKSLDGKLCTFARESEAHEQLLESYEPQDIEDDAWEYICVRYRDGDEMIRSLIRAREMDFEGEDTNNKVGCY